MRTHHMNPIEILKHLLQTHYACTEPGLVCKGRGQTGYCMQPNTAEVLNRIAEGFGDMTSGDVNSWRLHNSSGLLLKRQCERSNADIVHSDNKFSSTRNIPFVNFKLFPFLLNCSFSALHADVERSLRGDCFGGG